MSVKNVLMSIIMVLIGVAILINSLISTQYIDNYFKDYVTDQYNIKVENIKNYAMNLIVDGISNPSQAQLEIDNYINDPIVQISILDADNELVIMAQDPMFNMHSNMMMGRHYTTEDEVHTIKNNSKTIGTVVIKRNNAVQSSDTVKLFKRALWIGASLAGVVVLSLGAIMTAILSQRMTRDLRMTSGYAKAIEMDIDHGMNTSKVLEIRDIQRSLENLETKLKLQKNVRKEKADQLTHETRTPLTILKTHCEGALDGVVEMDQSRLESCINQIDNLSTLLSSIDEVVEYSGEKVVLKNEEFDLVSEVEKIMKGLKLQFENKGVDLELTGVTHLLLQSDRSLLTQAIYNLVTNAYKFTDSGGRVLINIEGTNEVVIKIIDTGVGIEENDLNHIFNAYYRSDQVSQIKGDGLGLFIVKRNLESLSGEIQVKSKHGEGTEMIIRLPN